MVSPVQHFCNPMDCSPPGSSVYQIPQARILEWVAISFLRGSSRPRDQTCVSCIGRKILDHWATREANSSIYFWLHWVSVAACGLCLVAMSGGYSSLCCMGFSPQRLLLWGVGSRHAGFSSCDAQAPEHRLNSCSARALVALRQVESSWTRDGIRVPTIDRQILIHCLDKNRRSPIWFFP